jgi:hypothetical protein
MQEAEFMFLVFEELFEGIPLPSMRREASPVMGSSAPPSCAATFSSGTAGRI